MSITITMEICMRLISIQILKTITAQILGFKLVKSRFLTLTAQNITESLAGKMTGIGPEDTIGLAGYGH